MKSTGLRRKIVFLFLAAVLAIPWAASAGLRLGSAQTVASSAPTILEDLLGRAWSYLMGVRDNTGCYIDPDGRCAPQPTIQKDTGCYIDPNGGCRP